MINYDKFKSYFENKCSESEADEIRSWLGNNCGSKHYDELLQKMWIEIEEQPCSPGDLKSEFSQFKRNRSKIIFKHRISILSRVAAILIIPTLILSIYFFDGSKNTEILYTELKTLVNEQKECILPDGTIVTLFESSTLRYNSEYGLAERRISFEGEAKFRIQKDSLVKFIVNTSKMNLVVTGTIFTMDARLNEDQTIVELEEGGVNVSFVNTPKKIIRIIPNKRAILDNNSGEIALSDIELINNNIISNNNPLVIEALSFKSTMKILEDHFNKKIVVEGIISSELFSCRFTSNNIYDILEIMRYYFDFSYTEENDLITITLK